MATEADARFDDGSFRDPSGRIVHWDRRILRTIAERAAPDYEFVRDSGILAELVELGMLLPAVEVGLADLCLPETDLRPRYVVEHPRIPLVSYPYEWPFRSLQTAAILHLDLHLKALERGATLSDASAYNIQFRGPNPVMIDLLSLRRYEAGEYWYGYRQFCQQFLNPLLLDAVLGIPFHGWYRGCPEGIQTRELARMLPVFSRFRPSMMMHVFALAALESRAAARPVKVTQSRLPKTSHVAMLAQLRSLIATLKTSTTRGTTWREYSHDNSYGERERATKAEIVARFTRVSRPAMLWDLGCNTGEYSEIALAEGACYAVGFDADHGALDQCYDRALARNLNLLPLYMDLTNQSPNQGWAQRERAGLAQRSRADALMALALVHHLALGKNVPLSEIVRWLFSLSPRLLVEFVPKADPMIARMLANRVDIFSEYKEEHFRRELARFGRVVEERRVSDSGRVIFWAERTAD